MNKLLAIIMWTIGTSVFSQIAPDTYLVHFTDKDNSPYSIEHPHEFLSQKAIERRANFKIPIIEQDLPVNPDYIQEVRNFGVKIKTVSKWFNTISIQTDNLTSLDSIRSLPFVRSLKSKTPGSLKPLINNKLHINTLKYSLVKTAFQDTSLLNYGESGYQIGMLNGHKLHNQNYQGQGMVIAILDGGFTGVDSNPAFDSLWDNNQILGTWDFVKNSPVSFNANSHGGLVLSIMAANMPGQMIGSAPKAGYYLLRTEFGPTEYLIEEEYWISGAEYADSVGADLINSSLSYSTFNDPSMDYTYDDMDGNTTRVSRAADIAASKGILVVVSAGNKGDTQWRYIGAPADADSVLTVGSVNEEKVYSDFSSLGPTSDGRIKPNTTAMGEGTAMVSSKGDIFYGIGTSFSTPIICGLAACLWQSNPDINNFQLIEVLQDAGSQATNPDDYLGYGLPDFSKAFFVVKNIDIEDINDNTLVNIFPNPFDDYCTIDYYCPDSEQFTVEIWDMTGRLVFREEYDPGYNFFHRIKITGLGKLNPGIFITRIISSDSVSQARIMKQNIKL